MLEKVRQILKKWSQLVQAGAAVASVIAVFLLPPPAALVNGDASLVGFSKFVTAVALGVLLYLARRYRSARSRDGWALCAVALLLLLIAGFFWYQHLRDQWTVSYSGNRVAIGNVLTADGKKYAALHPDLPPEVVLWDAGGDVLKIWTRASVQSCWQRLSMLYLSLFPLATGCIVSVLQLSRRNGSAR
jgi:hypothetical protein